MIWQKIGDLLHKMKKVYFLANLYVMVSWVLQINLLLLGLNNSNLNY